MLENTPAKSRHARTLLSRRRGVAVAVAALLILIAAAFALLRQWSSDVPLGPLRHVTTTNPKIGVHTRLTDEVEEWKIKRTWEMVREMGAPWVVEYFPWAYIEEPPGRYDWTHADLVVDHAAQQGLTVIARLASFPTGRGPKETTPLYLDDDRFDDFGRFAAEFAKRYAGTRALHHHLERAESGARMGLPAAGRRALHGDAA